MNVIVYGPRDRKPHADVYVNTTSHDRSDFGSQLSPFHLGPVDLYGGFVARTMENGWQYAKQYAVHADADGEPSDAYWQWSRGGWDNPRAVRYPMGKGAKPLCSLWDGERLGYLLGKRTLGDAVLNEKRPMGHAFVLQMLLETGRYDVDAMFAEGVLARGGPAPDLQRDLFSEGG
jgi:hypothetical protein